MKNKTMIIAEAGVNHNGSMDTALQLVNAAKDSGADVVKFQSFIAEKLVSVNAVKAEYQRKNLPAEDSSQLSMLKKLELSFDQQLELFRYGEKTGIQVASTAFDEQSIDFLHGMKIPFWKIPSGEIDNTPYLRKIGAFNNSVLLSTGMSTLSDIEYAIDVLVKAGTGVDRITLLHCTTEYPAPFDEVNLNVIQTLRKCFGLPVGYSDHTPGITVPVAAVAKGACVIEKHFTLDKSLPGPDHKASLEPDEFKEMVTAIRNVEKSLGDGIKRITKTEEKNIHIARKSIVAATAIKTGDILSKDNLTVKRPGTGISPRFWDFIVGRPALRDYAPDEEIE
jgi:N,N'-diacetyllegionaminate synthase